MFFVWKGMAYGSNASAKYQYFRFEERHYFGETHLLLGIPISYSVHFHPKTGAQVYFIPADKFLKICEMYPDSYNTLI